MLRVTADSNIYISGLISRRGNPYDFLQLARAGKIRLAVSDAILDEVDEVLERKFGWPQEDISDARHLIEQFAQKVKPSVILDAVKLDPDDNRILECAVAAGSDFIVSGDNHLLKLERYDSITILNVVDFLGLTQTRRQES